MDGRPPRTYSISRRSGTGPATSSISRSSRPASLSRTEAGTDAEKACDPTRRSHDPAIPQRRQAGPSRALALGPVSCCSRHAWLFLTWPWLSGRYTVPWDSKAHFQAQLAIPRRQPAPGRRPVLEPLRLRGLAADRRSAIADLFPPPSAAGGGRSRAVVARPRTRLAFAMLFLGKLGAYPDLSGSRLAAGRRVGRRRIGLRVRGVGGLAHPAHRPDPQPVLLSRGALWRSCGRWSAARPRTGFIAGLAAGMMVLGRDQIAWLGVYLLAGFVVWHAVACAVFRIGDRGARSAPILAGVVGGTLVAATFPLLMTLLLGRRQQSPGHRLRGGGPGSLHPASLLTAFVANLYRHGRTARRLLGPAQLRLGPDRSLSGPQHERRLSGRDPAPWRCSR